MHLTYAPTAAFSLAERRHHLNHLIVSFLFSSTSSCCPKTTLYILSPQGRQSQFHRVAACSTTRDPSQGRATSVATTALILYGKTSQLSLSVQRVLLRPRNPSGLRQCSYLPSCRFVFWLELPADHATNSHAQVRFFDHELCPQRPCYLTL